MSDLFGSIIERSFGQATALKPAIRPVGGSPLVELETRDSAEQPFSGIENDSLNEWPPRHVLPRDSHTPQSDAERSGSSLSAGDIKRGAASVDLVKDRVTGAKERLRNNDASPVVPLGHSTQQAEDAEKPIDRPTQGIRFYTEADVREKQIPPGQTELTRVVPRTAIERRNDERSHNSSVQESRMRASARPIVRVTIGRIEVKAVMQSPVPVARAPQPSGPRPQSLEEYLKERSATLR